MSNAARKAYVYIAGPYTSPDPARCVATAMEFAHAAMDAGHYPFCPHLSHFLHIQRGRHYEDWMAQDLAWLAKCDVLLRIAGHSPGADREEEEARRLGVEVFYVEHPGDVRAALTQAGWDVVG